MYGFKKTSRLFPVITFILYFGERDWDGEKDLHGILDFTDIPDCLKEKISNYKIHVVEVRKLTDTDRFRTDVKQVFDFIRFSRDKRKIKELMEEDAFDMVVNYAGEEAMAKMKEKYRKDGRGAGGWRSPVSG